MWKNNPLNKITSTPLRRLIKIAIVAGAVAAGSWATTQTDNPEIGKAVTEAIKDIAPVEATPPAPEAEPLVIDNGDITTTIED